MSSIENKKVHDELQFSDRNAIIGLILELRSPTSYECQKLFFEKRWTKSRSFASTDSSKLLIKDIEKIVR